MEDAFGALRRHSHTRGLKDFDVSDAVLCLVGLGYTPITLRHTLLPRHGLDLHHDPFIARRTRHIVDVLLHVLGGD